MKYSFHRRAHLLTFVVLTAITLTACTPKKVNVMAHSGPTKDLQNSGGTNGDVQVSSYDDRTEAKALRDKFLADPNRSYDHIQALNATIDDPKTSAAQLLAIVDSLKVYVLSPFLIDDLEFRGRDDLKRMLSVYNRALFTLTQSSSTQSAELITRLNEFTGALFEGCTAGLKNCQRFSFFAKDSLTSRLLVESIKKEPPTNANVGLYYKKLQIAVDLENQQSDIELFLMYVRYGQMYFDYLQASNGSDKQYELKRHRDVLSLVLTQISDLKGTNPKAKESFCTFISDAKPYMLSNEKNKYFDSATMKNFMAEYVNCASGPKLTGSIQDYVEFTKTEGLKDFKDPKKNKGSDEITVSPSDNTSYYQALEELKKSPFILSGLGIQSKPIDGLVFYAIENYFYERLDLASALKFMDQSKIDDNTLFDLIRQYVQVQTAYNTRATYITFAQIFNDEFKNSGVSADLFNRVIENTGKRSGLDWEKLKVRVNLFSNLTDNYLARYRNDQTATASNIKALSGQIKKFTFTIDHMVTYPMMIALSYYMSKAQTVNVLIPWISGVDNVIEMSAKDTMAKLFTAQNNISLFFPFGNLTTNLTAIEKLHALDFALRTGLFHFFQIDKIGGATTERLVDKAGDPANQEVVLFADHAKSMLLQTEQDLSNSLRDLELVSTNTGFRNVFKKACDNPETATSVVSLDSMSTSLNVVNDSVWSLVSKIYTLPETVGNTRATLEDEEKIYKVFEAYFNDRQAQLKIPSAKFAKRKEILERMASKLEHTRMLLRKLTRLSLQLDKDVVQPGRDCLERLSLAQGDRAERLMLMNIGFYKNVHAAMTLLQANSGKSGAMDQTTITAAIQAWKAKAVTKDIYKKNPEIFKDISERMTSLVKLGFSSGVFSKTMTAGVSSLAKGLSLILGIHNRANAPAGVGYFVNGVETAEVQEMKRVSILDPLVYTNGKWDTFMRVRSQLHDCNVLDRENCATAGGKNFLGIAPNLEIPLGSFAELEKNALYTGAEQTPIDYSDDPSRFVQDAMKLLGGESTPYFGWYSADSLTFYKDRMDFLMKLTKLEALETQDSDRVKCDKDVWGRSKAAYDTKGAPLVPNAQSECKAVQVRIEDYIEYRSRYVQMIRLNRNQSDSTSKSLVTSPDYSILKWLDKTSRRGDELKEAFAYNDEPGTSKWSWFDSWLAQSVTGQIVSNVVLRSFDGQPNFSYYNEVIQIAFGRDYPMIIPFNPQVDQLERNSIREKMFRHINYIGRTLHVIRDLENRKVDLGDVVIEQTQTPRSDDDILMGEWRYLKVSRRSNGTPIYLFADGEQAQFENNMSSYFGKGNFQCSALPQEGDSDFKLYKESLGPLQAHDFSNCPERYRAWRSQNEVLLNDEYAKQPLKWSALK